MKRNKLTRKVFSKIPGNTNAEKRANGKKIAREITRVLAEGFMCLFL